MRGEGALRQAGNFDELPCRKSVGFVLDKVPEGIEPCRMGERGEGEQGSVIVHTSELSDGYASVNTHRMFPMGLCGSSRAACGEGALIVRPRRVSVSRF